MKKTLAILLVMIMAIASSFAVVNNQKVYSVNDDVYSQIETLYIASGYGLPSSSGPWTGSELLLMMEKVDRDSLAQVYQNLYDKVMEKLQPTADFEFDTVSLDFGLELNLEAYYRQNAAKNAGEYQEDIASSTPALMEELTAVLTGTKDEISVENLGKWTAKFVQSAQFDLEEIIKDPSAAAATIQKQFTKFIGLTSSGTMLFDTDNQYPGYSEWVHGEDFRNPLLKVTMETWAAKNFYGYFEIAAGDNVLAYQYQKQFDVNYDFLTEYKLEDSSNMVLPRFALISWQFPQKALVSVGGDNWSLIAGRDKLSWGAGETGNLILSKSFDNHTFAQFTTFHNNFRYTLLGTYYPYYAEVYQGNFSNGQDSDNDVQDGFKSFIAHRLEYTMFNDKVNLAVTEACMVRKLKDEPFNLAMINPFGFMHNEYVRTNSNSILFFEADVTPIKGLNFYGQFALDDFTLPGASDDVVPDGNGFLVGAKANYAFGPGILTVNAEYAKTSPFLFLRGVYEERDKYAFKAPESYGFGFDAVTRYFSNLSAITYSNNFITYTYGNDVVVANVKAEYEIPEVLTITASYLGLTSGVMNINSPWGIAGDVNYDVKSPSTIDPYYNGPKGPEKEGALEYTTIFSFTAEYNTPIKGLSAHAIADLVSCKNYKNREGATFKDFQLTVGATLAL